MPTRQTMKVAKYEVDRCGTVGEIGPRTVWCPVFWWVCNINTRLTFAEAKVMKFGLFFYWLFVDFLIFFYFFLLFETFSVFWLFVFLRVHLSSGCTYEIFNLTFCDCFYFLWFFCQIFNFSTFLNFLWLFWLFSDFFLPCLTLFCVFWLFRFLSFFTPLLLSLFLLSLLHCHIIHLTILRRFSLRLAYMCTKAALNCNFIPLGNYNCYLNNK